jgi:hypothetical protein
MAGLDQAIQHTADITRVFVVGFPRSGTTLLQAVLAAQPGVFTLPETHSFRKIWGRGEPLRRFGIVWPRAARAMLERLERETGVRAPHTAPRWPTLRSYRDALVSVLDTAALAHGATAWVEKTPAHLWYLDAITTVADAHVVHLVRDGRLAVASYYERCLDPATADWADDALPPRQAARLDADARTSALIDGIVDLWNRSVAESVRWLSAPRHHLVMYRDLVTDPSAELERLSKATGMPFARDKADHRAAAQLVTGRRAGEELMENVFRPVQPWSLDKYESIFTPDQRSRIEARLAGGGSPHAALAALRPAAPAS